MSEVYIVKTANFLPNEPVSNDEMENYLGKIGERASKSRRIVLRNNGIKERYYAIDKEGNVTHTNAEIAAQSIRNLMDNDSNKLKEVDLLTCGTSVPDHIMPSHAVMVHGELPDSNAIEVISPSGNCCSGMHGFKYAYLSIKSGDAKKAICCASERLSRSLHADQFELEAKKMGELEANPYIAFEKDFLRWMLSDGAASFLLQEEKNTNGISLRIDWIEGYSFANEIESCMYMGTEKLADGTMKSFKDYKQNEIYEQSIMSIKQDTKLLGENIVKLGFKKLEGSIKDKGLTADDITYFLPHMSSFFFESKIAETLYELDLHIPKERWFTNLETTGNVGSASIFLMVDELFNSGKLKVGDTILLAIPESARFSYVFSLLTVC